METKQKQLYLMTSSQEFVEFGDAFEFTQLLTVLEIWHVHHVA